MAMTLLGYRAVMAELHSDDRRQARTASKVRAARATRRRKGV